MRHTTCVLLVSGGPERLTDQGSKPIGVYRPPLRLPRSAVSVSRSVSPNRAPARRFLPRRRCARWQAGPNRRKRSGRVQEVAADERLLERAWVVDVILR